MSILHDVAARECFKCYKEISEREEYHSTKQFGILLCLRCQKFFEGEQKRTQPEVFELYLELTKRGFSIEVEKRDTHKTVDLAIEEAKLYIEVDGRQHFDSDQSIRDLFRSYYSLEAGYYTFHIPNAAIRDNIFATADAVCKIIRIRVDQLTKSHQPFLAPSILTVEEKRALIVTLLYQSGDVLIEPIDDSRLLLKNCGVSLYINAERVDIIFEENMRYVTQRTAIKKFLLAHYPRLKAWFNYNRINIAVNQNSEVIELYKVIREAFRTFNVTDRRERKVTVRIKN